MSRVGPPDRDQAIKGRATGPPPKHAFVASLAGHGHFHWTACYDGELAEATGRALGAGGLALSAEVLLLWRQRLVDLIGTGRRALR